jgi:RNA 2',3'-cyclic 3'-phosphodiesterase
MRIFVALDIDRSIRDRIERFMDGVRGFAPDARWVQPESMHVTLKFVGEKPEKAVDEIRQALSSAKASGMELTVRGYGFFPTLKAARVFWVGVDAGPELPALAKTVDEVIAAVGVPREDHPFSPHLTLARAGRDSGLPRWKKGDGPRPTFQKLQEKLAALPTPEFGTMAAREFFLYESQLARSGAKYTKIARFALQ